MSDSAQQNSRWPGWLRSIQTMNTAAAAPMPTKNQRCQPEAPARNENAAPALCTRTRLKNEVMLRLSPSWNMPMTSVLVNWSARMMISAMPSQGSSDGPGCFLVTISATRPSGCADQPGRLTQAVPNKHLRTRG